MKKEYATKVSGAYTHVSGWIEIAPHPRYPSDTFHSLFLSAAPVWPIENGKKVHFWGSSHINGMDWCETLPADTPLNGGPETVLEFTRTDFPGKGIEKPEHPPWGEYPPSTNEHRAYMDWGKTDSLRLSPDQMHVLREGLRELLIRKTRLQADLQLSPEEVHEANLLREVFWVVNVALHGYHHHACIPSSEYVRMGLSGADAEALDTLDRLESSPPPTCDNCHKTFGDGVPLIITLNESFGWDGAGCYPLDGHPPVDSAKQFCSDGCFAQFLHEHPEEAVFYVSDVSCCHCGKTEGNFMSAKGEYGSEIDDINRPYYFCSTFFAYKQNFRGQDLNLRPQGYALPLRLSPPAHACNIGARFVVWTIPSPRLKSGGLPSSLYTCSSPLKLRRDWLGVTTLWGNGFPLKASPSLTDFSSPIAE